MSVCSPSRPACLLAGLLALALPAYSQVQSPTITTLNPVRHAQSAGPSAPIAVTFSQPMSPGTATPTAMRVTGSQTGQHPGTYAGGGSATIALDPATDFRAGELVSVSVTTAAQTPGGTPLAAPLVYQFRTASAPAQAAFSAISQLQSNGEAFDVAPADFDGDGDVDLASTDWLNHKVLLSQNLGAGVLAPPVVISSLYTASGIQAADMDLDGDLDLLAASADRGDLRTLRNDGTGAFTDDSTLHVAAGIRFIATADFDGDGDPDIATANYDAGSVSVLLNNRLAGTYDTISHFPLVRAHGIVAGDWDSDGDLDLAAASPLTTLCVAFNDGYGHFTVVNGPPTGTDNWSVFAADLDGDHDLDLVTENTKMAGSITICFNNGTGAFTATSLTTHHNPTLLGSADVDGDGDADIAVTARNAGSLQLLRNDGAGAFTPTYYNVANNSMTRGGTIVDLDGDGALDLILRQTVLHQITTLLNVALPTGRPEELMGANLTITPNPFQEDAAVRFTLPAAAAATLTLRDVLGRVVRSQALLAQAGENVLHLTATAAQPVAPGAYVLEVVAGDRRLVQRVVQQ